MTVTLSERKIYPVYILLDVSASMRETGLGGSSPHEEFQQMIPDLVMSLAESRALAKAAWISVIAFGDHAELLCPMTSLSRPPHVRSPHEGRHTDYAAALSFLADRIRPDRATMEATGAGQNYRTRVARPLIFFITDGAPYAAGRYQPPVDWMPSRNRLIAPPVEARIAAIGLDGAHGGTLHALATGRPGGERNAFVADPADPSAGDSLAASVINVIERSIRLSVRAGDLVIDEPRGMRRVHV